MRVRVAQIEDGTLPADESVGVTWSSLGDDGRFAAASFPAVRSVAVDNAAHTVTVETENALLARLISDGRQIDALPAGNAVFDLDDYAGQLGDYVRIELFGEGGVVYTQAFLLNAERCAETGPGRVTDGPRLDLGFFDFLFAEAHKLFGILRRSLGALR